MRHLHLPGTGNWRERGRALLAQLNWKQAVMLTVAGIINAFGVTCFIAPVNLYDSGISGTSILLSQLTPEAWTISIFLMVLNIPLFLYGLSRQGGAFTLCAIYAVSIYSLFAWLINDVFPVDVSIASPLAGSDLLLCAIFGGLISGLGSGLAIRYGGAMDGIEVLAVIFARRLNLSVGTFVMGYNLALYVVCGFLLHSWILPLYSIVTYAAALKTVDFVVEGLDRAKAATIVTTRPDQVGSALSQMFECGITVTQAKGFYSGEPKTILYVVLNRFQISRMRETVHGIDPKAYISVAEVADVFHPDGTH